MTTKDFKRKLTAILSADVVGYSRLMGEDEESTVRTLNKYKELIFNLVEKNNGRVIDSPGDNILSEFASVVDAVRCGVQIQEDLKGHNEELPSDKVMEFRIGIHTGDVIQDGDRIYGDGVNIAARIESLADAGGICLSSSAYDQVKKKLNYEYEHLGEYEVKNIDEPVSVYKVLMVSKTTGNLDEEKKTSSGRFLIKNITIVIVIIIVGLLVWQFYPKHPEEQVPKTIAVLPFEDISPEKDQEYFVDGLSEELLNSLTNIPNLLVTARTSSFAFKGTDKKIQDIAEELGVDHILEGSVRKAGNTLRITSQLIRAVDGFHLWSKTYDRELKNANDILSIQGDIATAVADELKLKLGVGKNIKQLGGTDNLEAYELYLVAKAKRAEPDLKKSLELINAAIVLDPEFAMAWSFKANNHFLLSVHGPSIQAIAEAEAALNAVQKAIKLEPDLGDTYFILGNIKALRREWIQAELNYRKALKMTDKTLSGDYLINVYYTAVGNFKRVLEILGEMKKTDPKNTDVRAWYYYTYGYLGDRQRAEEEYQLRNRSMTKGYSDWHDAVITEVRLGSGDLLSRDDIVSSRPIHNIGKKHLESPEEGLLELRRIYTGDKNLSANQFARISLWAAYFGDYDFAIEAIEKSISTHALSIHVLWAPTFQKVRQLSRFKEIVREIGLVDYWKVYGWPDLCRPVGEDDFECD